MFDQMEKMVDKLYPIKKVSIVLPEKLSASYEKCLADSIMFSEMLQYENLKDSKLLERGSQIKLNILATQQFIIEQYAPDEYKQLTDPCPILYSTELRKVTFIIAEKNIVELRKTMFTNTLSSSIKMAANKLGKEKINDDC